ncbi:MAG: DNA-binding protein [Anabaena sp. WA113]|jgi:predicted transcriptional regulator YheO|nr:MAG: DNA-binding protein [Anabaena sp. WA113]
MAKKTKKTKEQKLLLDQLKQVAHGVGATFAPFCEVVLHDLLDPKHAVLAVHNNLSGRQIGSAATELGLARILDPDYPQVLPNYANQFADGRPVKSTSIGIKDADGQYIAALCLNLDLSLFKGLQSAMSQFVAVDTDAVHGESLDPANAEAIRQRIDRYAARLLKTPRTLKVEERRALLKALKADGLLEVRRSMETVAAYLGVSRASVYGYAK